jgi:hypothetical protein
LQNPLFKRYADVYYDPKDPTNLLVFESQQLFLAAAAQVIPCFAEQLFQVVWTAVGDRIRSCGSLPAASSSDFVEYYSGLFAAIREWAKSFNIEAHWVVDEAHSAAICGLLYREKGIDPIVAMGTWRRSVSGGYATRQFQLPVWQPTMESQSSYIRRADREWQKARDEHIAAVELQAEQQGLEKIPSRRNRKHGLDVKFEWAALRRCLNTPYEQIALEADEDLQYVKSTVREILDRIGFAESAKS